MALGDLAGMHEGLKRTVTLWVLGRKAGRISNKISIFLHAGDVAGGPRYFIIFALMRRIFGRLPF